MVEVAVAAVPGAEVEVRGVDFHAADSHVVAAAVVFLAGSAPQVSAKPRASNEKLGLTRSLKEKGMLRAK